MKILVIPSWYPTATKKNNGSFFKEQSEALARREGLDVSVINGAYRSREAYLDKHNFVKTVKEVNKVDLHERTYPNLGLMKFTNLSLNIYYRNIESMFKDLIKEKGKPDVIHAHSFFLGGAAACRLGKKYQIPVVVTEHASAVLNKRIP